MELRRPGLGELVGKSIVAHTVTNFVMGVFAFFLGLAMSVAGMLAAGA